MATTMLSSLLALLGKEQQQCWMFPLNTVHPSLCCSPFWGWFMRFLDNIAFSCHFWKKDCKHNLTQFLWILQQLDIHAKRGFTTANTLSQLGYSWKLLFHPQRVFNEHFHSCAISNYPSQAIRIAGLRYCVYSCLHQVGPAIKQATDWEGIAHRRILHEAQMSELYFQSLIHRFKAQRHWGT